MKGERRRLGAEAIGGEKIEEKEDESIKWWRLKRRKEMDGCPVVEMKRTLKGGWLVPSARDQFKYLNFNIQGSTGGQGIFLGVGKVAVKKPEGIFDMWYTKRSCGLELRQNMNMKRNMFSFKFKHRYTSVHLLEV